MDLNMIKGLGPTFRQTMYKNEILDVEQLVKLLPNNIKFHEPININEISSNSYVTLEVTILTYIDSYEDSEKISFTVESCGKSVLALVKKRFFYRKHLVPGTKFKIRGNYDVSSNTIDVDSLFDVDSKIFESVYEIGDLASSQIHNFIEKGLTILNEYNNELPEYIKEKLEIKQYSDILNNIHLPKSCDAFNNALKNFTYEILFNYFTSYYYYILSTSMLRTDEVAFDISKISDAIKNFSIQENEKKALNVLLKEYKKNVYSNVLLERTSNDEKKLFSIMAIISKVSIKKQIVIVSKENFEFYSSLREELLKYNIKMDVMARKGRNKENFDSFNSGKFDILLTPPVNFDTLDTKKVGLVIIDEESFNISKRFSLNCNNSDTLFFANSTIGESFDRNIFKNLNIINLINNDRNNKQIIFENLLSNDNFKVINDLLSETEINDLLLDCTNDSFEFIKSKKFKDTKQNYEYFKKLINSLK